MRIRFIKTTTEKYNAQSEKDNNALYFLEDEKTIYKGDTLYASSIIKLDNLEGTGKEGILYSHENKLYLYDSTNKWQPLTSGSEGGAIDASKIAFTKDGESTPTNVQAAINELFITSNSITKSFTDIIGETESKDKSFSQMVDEIILCKRDFAKMLNEKGITASAMQSFSELVKEAKEINNLNVIRNTKLNMEENETKEINLSKPHELEELCMSVLKYTPEGKGIQIYDCKFDNSDKVNFEKNDLIIFVDGTMKQSITKKIFKKTETKKVDEKYTISTIPINLTNNTSIFDIEYTNDGDMTALILPEHTIQFASKDIKLNHVYEISKIDWTTDVQNPNKLLLLFSTDKGKTYKTIYQDKIEIINTNDLKEVSLKGMTPEYVHTLSGQLLNTAMLTDSNRLRFAYYFENNANGTCSNDNITLTVNMKGSNSIPEPDSYIYNLNDDQDKIVLNFKKKGTYTILWVDGR